MKVAVCGSFKMSDKLKKVLDDNDIEVKYFVNDPPADDPGGGGLARFFESINFFEFRRLYKNKIVDGLLICEPWSSDYVRIVTRLCRFYGIDKVGFVDLRWSPFRDFYWFDKEKSFMTYIETHVIDSCNLNCRYCGHLVQLFTDDDFYDLEAFEQDIKRISENVNLLTLRLMGGEPFRSKNLDQYIEISRKYFPQTNIMVVTNGLLIPSAPQKFFDAMRENQCLVWISVYKPTFKIIDKIEARLKENGIPFAKDGRSDGGYIDQFMSAMSLKSANIKILERVPTFCPGKICKFLRDGKLYKCPLEAFSFECKELGVKELPDPVAVDIYDKNFSLLLDMLTDSTMIGACNYCRIPVFHDWEIKNTVDIEDFLVNPAEKELLKNS